MLLEWWGIKWEIMCSDAEDSVLLERAWLEGADLEHFGDLNIQSFKIQTVKFWWAAQVYVKS